MRGRKPDPKAAKRGTAHDRKKTDIAPAEVSGAVLPESAASIPLPPQIPGNHKRMKALWRILIGEVSRHELRQGDLMTLEQCIVAKYRAVRAGEIIKRDGMMVKDRFGEPKPHPMLAEERQQAILCDRLSQRLGLSPEARVRLDLMQIAGANLGASFAKQLKELSQAPAPKDAGDVIDGELVKS